MALLKSIVASANTAKTDFPLNNLPYGVFVHRGQRYCGVAIGDMILNITAMKRAGLLEFLPADTFADGRWNRFMALGSGLWSVFRKQISAALAQQSEVRKKIMALLVKQRSVQMCLPFDIAEYTDFYASRQHAENMGRILRGAADLPANWLDIPIGYNGRASSVVVSGTDIHRPLGQLGAGQFGPSAKLDFELEIGTVVGGSSKLGQPVSTAEADAMIFGFVLLNDWSARDIQAWEAQPLGPFLGKAFATGISPWIVPKEALEAFRRPAPLRKTALLPYLEETKPGLYDIELEVRLQPAGADKATRLSKTNADRLYYSAAQQLCHHAIGGCPMRTGDLLGSGTISGARPSEYGSMIELGWNGKKPIKLESGEARYFIEDGDRLTLRGHAQGQGFRIGFGECTGAILPAINTPGWAK
ncbi:MAG: fumarylacetoacetase [Rhodobacteraceae bacterium]|nr:fumarylacetoacetase [Paracoccaceae bacterium]